LVEPGQGLSGAAPTLVSRWKSTDTPTFWAARLLRNCNSDRRTAAKPASVILPATTLSAQILNHGSVPLKVTVPLAFEIPFGASNHIERRRLQLETAVDHGFRGPPDTVAFSTMLLRKDLGLSRFQCDEIDVAIGAKVQVAGPCVVAAR